MKKIKRLSTIRTAIRTQSGGIAAARCAGNAHAEELLTAIQVVVYSHIHE